jgi:hypothetical protein
MFATVRALWGTSVRRIVDLRRRFGADVLVVRPAELRRPWTGAAPFTAMTERFVASGRTPAALRLPARCETFRHGGLRAYGLACVARYGPPS